jgi:hypothetical protein
MRYVDLPEFGLHFVPFEDVRFPELANAILAQPRPIPIHVPNPDDLRESAVLLNESDKAIVAFAVSWLSEDAEGRPQGSRFSNLGSSAQMDILLGIAPPNQHIHSCILPKSKRLITEITVFGDNSDVLPESAYSGRMGGGGGGAYRLGHRSWSSDELVLDFVIFEEGLFVGPDIKGEFDRLVEDIECTRAVAAEAERALRDGASGGHVFDLILPLARERQDPRSGRRHPMQHVFGQSAVHTLARLGRHGLIDWFARYAQSSAVSLRRAT